MTRGLTHKQEMILRFILHYTRENGYPPTIREIGNQFGISSLRGVTVHLDALQRKGYIEREHKSRSIRVVHPDFVQHLESSPDVVMLPLVGTIAAGTPILASQNIEALIPVPREMVHNIEGAFLLRVRGDSMVGEHILPRDLVIIKPQSTAENGELVAVLIGDEATVKRIQYDNGKVRLLPANPAYEPIEVRPEETRVIGKVIGLLRSYDRGLAY